MKRSAITAVTCAALLGSTVARSDACQDALKEAERESPHQQELQGLSKDLLEENRRETP